MCQEVDGMYCLENGCQKKKQLLIILAFSVVFNVLNLIIEPFFTLVGKLMSVGQAAISQHTK